MPVNLVRTVQDDDDVVEDVESDDDIQFEAFGEGLKQTHAWDFKPLISQMTHKERRSMASMSDRIEQKLQERKKAALLAAQKNKEEAEAEGEEESGDAQSDVDMEDEKSASGDSSEEETDNSEAESEDNSSKGLAATKSNTAKQKSQVEPMPKTPAASNQRKKKKTTATFESIGLSRPLLRAIEDLGYPEPTPIQAAAIPLIMMGKDVLGCALTGSGKTAAFLLPCLERYRSKSSSVTRILVLTPTRELALQCQSVMTKLARLTDIRSTLIVGGLDSEAQQQQLRTNPDVVIATPGRLIDHILNTRSFGLEGLEVLILDEADRLL